MAGLLSSLARQGAEANKGGARGQRRGRLRTTVEKSFFFFVCHCQGLWIDCSDGNWFPAPRRILERNIFLFKEIIFDLCPPSVQWIFRNVRNLNLRALNESFVFSKRLFRFWKSLPELWFVYSRRIKLGKFPSKARSFVFQIHRRNGTNDIRNFNYILPTLTEKSWTFKFQCAIISFVRSCTRVGSKLARNKKKEQVKEWKERVTILIR